MKRLILGASLILSCLSGAYEIPQGMVGISGLKKAQEKAKESGKPIVLVVAHKNQPET